MLKFGFNILLKNINNLRKYDISTLKNRIDNHDNKLMIDRITHYYEEHHPELIGNFKKELSFINENPASIAFPYRQLKRLESITSGYDNQRKLPYVIHENKKLYFPHSYPVEAAVAMYREYVEVENLLGGEYKEKAPHQYETETFFVKKDDVLLDIGCAEALFSLHLIDRVKKVYLVESDPIWFDALNATFEPYKDKVEIIRKLVTHEDTNTTTTLSSLLNMEPTSSIFIKMDIEGFETTVLNASKDALSARQNISLVCTTYHKKTDAEELAALFSSLDYKIDFSDGYILFIYGEQELKAPYFRKGIIRARKSEI